MRVGADASEGCATRARRRCGKRGRPTAAAAGLETSEHLGAAAVDEVHAELAQRGLELALTPFGSWRQIVLGLVLAVARGGRGSSESDSEADDEPDSDGDAGARVAAPAPR